MSGYGQYPSSDPYDNRRLSMKDPVIPNLEEKYPVLSKAEAVKADQEKLRQALDEFRKSAQKLVDCWDVYIPVVSIHPDGTVIVVNSDGIPEVFAFDGRRFLP